MPTKAQPQNRRKEKELEKKNRRKENYSNNKKEFWGVICVLGCTYYILVVFELKTERNQTCVFLAISHVRDFSVPCGML